MTLLEQPRLVTPAELRFTVYGEAKPGGSKKGFVNPRTGRVVITEDSKNRPWRQEVAGAGLAARVDAPWGDCAADMPLIVEFTFFRSRPKSHYGSGRNSGLLKGSASLAPATRPDLLKLARLAEDALTGILWRDDALIVREMLAKRWGAPERLEIMVAAL